MAQVRNITATLNYHLDPSKGGSDTLYAGTVGANRRKYAPVDVKIKDIRGAEEKPHIDTHGFQLFQEEATEKLFDDDARIKSSYYPECADLIKKATGATTVKMMAHITRRRSQQDAIESEKHLPDMARTGGPATANFVHVDQSYEGAKIRVGALFPEDKPKMDKCRWGIINVWRPIERPVTRSALAMCDARTIPDKDLAEVMVVFPSKNTSDEDKENQVPKGKDDPYAFRSAFGTWALKPPAKPEDHQWYYASEMKPDEALLLKIFDSKKTGVARRSPHTAFTSGDDYGPERQSLEVRCFVMWEDQTSD